MNVKHSGMMKQSDDQTLPTERGPQCHCPDFASYSRLFARRRIAKVSTERAGHSSKMLSTSGGP
eukprot:13484039-Alexandrium_andersonii.AAC.1